VALTEVCLKAISAVGRLSHFGLEAGKRPGDKIPDIGHDVYKVRLANPSAQRGKSGGFRVIYYVQVADSVFLLKIYSKTEQNDISADDIRRIVQELLPPPDDDVSRL
jgi:mRNA-degrading endonuclease RelE of RelBE toxin-antitoxin system